MLITRTNYWQPGVKKRTIKTNVKVGPVTVKFITIVLIALAALFYLSQSTQASTFKYKIMDLEEQKNKGQTDVNQLEIESARLKSLNEINNSAQKYNLESIN